MYKSRRSYFFSAGPGITGIRFRSITGSCERFAEKRRKRGIQPTFQSHGLVIIHHTMAVQRIIAVPIDMTVFTLTYFSLQSNIFFLVLCQNETGVTW